MRFLLVDYNGLDNATKLCIDILNDQIIILTKKVVSY